MHYSQRLQSVHKCILNGIALDMSKINYLLCPISKVIYLSLVDELFNVVETKLTFCVSLYATQNNLHASRVRRS